MNDVTYTPIGVIHSPFKEPKNVPIQASASQNTEGTVEIYPQYVEGLSGLEGFSHIMLLYHFHLAKFTSLTVKPFLDDKTHGLFSTRSPARPNRIGISVVQLKRVDANILHVSDVDVIDGTPLLDLKPFVPAFDCRQPTSIGWFSTQLHRLPNARDDGRFCK